MPMKSKLVSHAPSSELYGDPCLKLSLGRSTLMLKILASLAMKQETLLTNKKERKKEKKRKRKLLSRQRN